MTYKNTGNTVIEGSNGYFNNIRWDTYLGKYFNVGVQGYNSGFTSGGFFIPTTWRNDIQSFPFAATTTGTTNVGDLTVSNAFTAGQSSQEYGYTAGGDGIPSPLILNVIDRFPFAAPSDNAADVGDLTVARNYLGGNSSDSYGYTNGGLDAPGTVSDIIERWPFSASTTNATDVGNLTVARTHAVGQSSVDYGYCSTGFLPPSSTEYNIIDRWPFASSTTNATDVGDVSFTRGYAGGQSSVDYGYCSGGGVTPPLVYSNVIDRWPFSASTTNATDVGNLTVARAHIVGQNSVEYGYSSGGQTGPPNTSSNVIDRFPFAVSTTNATDVGDLVITATRAAGQQY